MQPATDTPLPAKPHPDWLWSDKYERWYAPGTSPVNGMVPPVASRFAKGDPRAVELGTQAGIISAKARAKLAADDREIDKIVARWIRDAQRGDNRAREQLLDRIEGKVEQQIRATVESRYIIEEAGILTVPDINIGTPTLEIAAPSTSDNPCSDAHSASETKPIPPLPVRNE